MVNRDSHYCRSEIANDQLGQFSRVETLKIGSTLGRLLPAAWEGIEISIPVHVSRQYIRAWSCVCLLGWRRRPTRHSRGITPNYRNVTLRPCYRQQTTWTHPLPRPVYIAMSGLQRRQLIPSQTDRFERGIREETGAIYRNSRYTENWIEYRTT